MLSIKIETKCAHCDNKFGVEFIKGADDPIYFNLAENDDNTKLASSSDLQELQEEYGEMYYKDVVVICQKCSNANVVQVPSELVPKRSVTYILGNPIKPGNVV